MIHVIATIQLTPGRRADFLKEFHALVPSVKAEPGCLDYGPTIDIASGIPVQGALREDVVTVVERWKDLDALRAHLVAPHMQAYRTKVKDLVQGTQLQVLGPA
ncbi:MAG TPA: putative quinol monooxygenase [Pirellulales bacterium]